MAVVLVMAMARKGIFFRLKPGAAAGYEKAHNHIWPEMRVLLNEAGFHDYSIWRHENLLFACYKLEDEMLASAVLEASETYARWRKYMEEFVYIEPSTGYKEWPMELMFLHEGRNMSATDSHIRIPKLERSDPMSYYNKQESEARIAKVRSLLKEKGLDAALVYYDELNIANGWYLTGWCPQFEKGAVLIPLEAEPLLLGGPESEPFARMSSAIPETRNFSAFMVPDEEYPNATIIGFADLNEELRKKGCVLGSIGLVGSSALPHNVYTQLEEGFAGVTLTDITADYEAMRAYKTPWEAENVHQAFGLSYKAFEAMAAAVKPGATEIEIAAEGEYACRKNGANSFAYATIVGSGERSNAVVPTAINKQLESGEWVMLGIAPRVNGYAGTMGETLPVSGTYSAEQKEAINTLRKALRITRDLLRPGISGEEIDVPARELFRQEGLLDYLVCPFAHTIGLMEAEGPFYGPSSKDVLAEGMTVCVDVSFFGHPTLHGARVETGYLITADGCKPLCPEMDARFNADL